MTVTTLQAQSYACIWRVRGQRVNCPEVQRSEQRPVTRRQERETNSVALHMKQVSLLWGKFRCYEESFVDTRQVSLLKRRFRMRQVSWLWGRFRGYEAGFVAKNQVSLLWDRFRWYETGFVAMKQVSSLWGRFRWYEAGFVAMKQVSLLWGRFRQNRIREIFVKIG